MSAGLVAALALGAWGNGDRESPIALPKGASGTVIAARDGRIAYCRGVGMADRAAKVAAGCDTVYDVMSITKQFTAAAIVKLEMRGKLRVTDPMSTFVGPVPDDKRDVTLHHLLTHTAGFTEALGDDYDALSREGMLDAALTSRLQSPPGRRFHYSNLGYSILAAIVENASGMSYERFLAKHLFAPAGMMRTGYVLPRWNHDLVAVEYDRNSRSKGKPFDHPWAADGPYWNLRGNDGMLSTARDMFRWHRALEGDEILSKRAKRKVLKPHVRVGDGAHSGYGWGILPGRVATHSGGNGWSFGVYARFLGDGAMVFWISNHAYRDGKWNLERLARKLTLGIAERVTRRAPGRPRA